MRKTQQRGNSVESYRRSRKHDKQYDKDQNRLISFNIHNI
jgi:hypothetical protein